MGFWVTNHGDQVSTRSTPLVTGSDLRKFRRIRRAPQQAIADWFGVSRNTVSIWEQNEDKPLPPMAARELLRLREEMRGYKQGPLESVGRRGRPIQAG